MAHTIVVQEQGTGSGGSAVTRIEYTPDHAVPPVLQVRKAEKAARVVKKLHEYLYDGGAYPLADEDGGD
jgi:hypothetical protein